MDKEALFKEHRIESRPDMNVCLYYDIKNRVWICRGYVCPKCNKRISGRANATKHKCSKGHYRIKYEDDDIESWNIKTVSGRPFKKIVV